MLPEELAVCTLLVLTKELRVRRVENEEAGRWELKEECMGLGKLRVDIYIVGGFMNNSYLRVIKKHEIFL